MFSNWFKDKPPNTDFITFMKAASPVLGQLQKDVELLAGHINTIKEFNEEIVGRISSLNDHMRKFRKELDELKRKSKV
jgi:chaperonin cofactor prefoldin